MHTELELFYVCDCAGRHSIWNLLAHTVIVPPLLCLTPQVRAAVHAGNVEDCNTFQGGVAEVKDDAITLGEGKRERER